MRDTFTIKTETMHTFTAGWGVSVTPVFAGEDAPDPEVVADIDVAVVEITAEAVSVVGEAPCVKIAEHLFMPVGMFKDVPDLTEGDTHDLRTRWFATREEAQKHAQSVLDTWANPAPWVSFVRLA